jgi:hypothetical protein
MSHAKLTHDLLLLRGDDLSDNSSDDSDTSSDSSVVGGFSDRDKEFFDDIIGGYLNFDSEYDSDNNQIELDNISNISEIVDIFSDNEDFATGGYLAIRKDIDDNRNTYEESELSEKSMYMGALENNIFSDDSDDSDMFSDDSDDASGGRLNNKEENKLSLFNNDMKNYIKHLPVIPHSD